MKNLEQILDQITILLDECDLENIFIPIEAITQFSKFNETSVSKIAPRTTPKLLMLFRQHHGEGMLG